MIELSYASAFLFFTAFLMAVIGIIVHNATKLTEINSRSFKIEHQLAVLSTNMQMSQMENSFDEMMEDQQKSNKGGPKAIFRTADGKYVAGSLKELFEKMTSDPHSPIDKSEIEALKKIFDQISSDIENDDDEDDED